jgi:aquaporin Z
MKKLLAEGIGTCFLVLLACGSAVLAGPTIGAYGIGVCFGLVLICLAYGIGGVSGCHVNPAVSLAVWLSGRMEAKEFIGYVVAQFIGAAVGGGLLYLLVSVAPGYTFGGVTEGTANLAANVLQPGATSTLALISEILLTFFFVFVILGVTDEKYGAGNFAGLAIGIALGLVNIVGIPVDNCSVNPARSFGPALWQSGAWGDFWIMVVGPVVGAILAALLWKVVAANKK